MNTQWKTLLLTYVYAAITAIAALWTSGTHDWKSLVGAALTAVVAPAVQAANPADTAAGVGATPKN